jgi:hypothetical protein
MKTPMQELLGLVEQMFNNAKTIEVESAMNDVINIITQEGLPKEKKQIIKAYNSAIPFHFGEQYYNETFKTNEK